MLRPSEQPIYIIILKSPPKPPNPQWYISEIIKALCPKVNIRGVPVKFQVTDDYNDESYIGTIAHLMPREEGIETDLNKMCFKGFEDADGGEGTLIICYENKPEVSETSHTINSSTAKPTITEEKKLANKSQPRTEQLQTTNEDDDEEYSLMPERIVKGSVKGCLKVVATIVIIISIFGLLFFISSLGEAGAAIGSIIVSAYYIFGLFCVLYLAPRKIFKESKQLKSRNRAIFSVLLGIVINIAWWGVLLSKRITRIGAITLGDLISSGVTFLIGYGIILLIWSILKPQKPQSN